VGKYVHIYVGMNSRLDEIRAEAADISPQRLPHGVSILVPVYNSSEILPILIERLRPVAKSLNMPFELILVNDGSSDGSWNVIRALAAKHTWIRGIRLMRNYGQHNALLCGIRAAKHEIVVTLDDDLQHPPEEVPKLLNKLVEGYDVVYGAPEKKQHGFWRKLASLITRWTLRSALGSQTAFDVSAFRALRTQTRDAFERYHSPYVSIDVLLGWATTRFTSVKVRHDPRRFGESTYTFCKLASHALAMITGFSTLPLRFASLLGFGFTIFGFFLLVYVLGRYFIEGGSLPGFPFLASTISIFSGVQLFALGVVGEYLAGIHFRTMDRPIYTIRSTT
jgi:glycosyltransferase involved in cell wall biosynthesis